MLNDDYSLLGYESVLVDKYLPILQTIKDDLNIIYNSRVDTAPSLNHDIFGNANMQTNNVNQIKLPSTRAEVETVSETRVSNINISLSHSWTSTNMLHLVDLCDGSFASVMSSQNVAGNTNVEDSLRNEIQTLKEELLAKNNENAQMKDQLSRCQERVESLETEYVKKDTSNNTGDLDDQFDGSDASTMNSQSVARSSNVEDSLRDEIKLLIEEVQSRNNENEQIKETLNDNNNQIISLNNTISNQTDELTQKDDNIRNLREEINRLKDELSRCQETVESLENKYVKETKTDDQVDQKYALLLDNLRKKREEVREKDHKISDLENEVEDFKMKCRRLEKMHKTVTSNYESIKQEFEECEKQKDDYQEKFKNIFKENKKLKRDSIDEGEKVRYKNELKSYKEQLRKKDDELKQHESLVTELIKETEENGKAKGKLEELEKCKLQIKEITKELEEKDKKFAELEEDCSKKKQAMEVMKNKIKTESDPQEMKKLNFQLKAVNTELEHTHNKVENLNVAYEEKAKEHDLAMRQIQNKQAEIDNLKKLLSSTDQQRTLRQASTSQERSDVDEFPSWWKNHMVRR